MFFFFNDPPPPEIYTLSLHDALPIYDLERRQPPHQLVLVARRRVEDLQLDIHGQRRPVRQAQRDTLVVVEDGDLHVGNSRTGLACMSKSAWKITSRAGSASRAASASRPCRPRRTPSCRAATAPGARHPARPGTSARQGPAGPAPWPRPACRSPRPACPLAPPACTRSTWPRFPRPPPPWWEP